MNILIDIGHPGHVHLLRNTYFQLIENGHKIWVTVKNIPIAKKLLELYNIDFIDIGSKSDSLFGKALSQFDYNIKILLLVKKYKIQIGVGSSITLAHVSKLSKMKSILLDDDDDEVQPLFVKYAHPFTNTLLSPDALKAHRQKKNTLFYSGYHELAYLHPNRFTPDPSVLKKIGLTKNDPFFIMRFNVFKAHHDAGVIGMSLKQKQKLIGLLEFYGKVYITTEREIEPELLSYQLPISPDKIHSLMYYSNMFLGDSQTMASEAAILGTPSLKLNTLAGELSVPNELEEKYDLCYSYKPQDYEKLIVRMQELLTLKDLQSKWHKKKDKMLSEKIDTTAFLVWFIENYPQSIKIVKENPDYNQNFK